MAVVWVEKTGLLDLVLLLPGCLIGGGEIRYDEHRISPPAKAALDFLKRAGLARRIIPAKLSLNQKDDHGRALNYLREAALDKISNDFCAKYLSQEPRWFQRAAQSCLSNYLMFRVTFIIMIEAESKHWPMTKHVLYLARHPANALLWSSGCFPGFKFRQSLSPREALKNIFGPLVLFSRALAGCFLGRKVRTDIVETRPSVWVEYYPDDLDGYVSRAFWRDHVDAKTFDRVFYLDRSDTPCDAETAARIASRGFHWVDCQDIFRLSRLGFKDAASLVLQLFKFNFRRPLWFHFFRFKLELLTEVWTDIFKTFKVKLLIQHQEFSWMQMAQVRALDAAGGSMIGFHWSDFPFLTEPIHITPQHVFFVWGQANYRWLEGKGHDCRYILPCGAWIMPDEKVSAGLRAQLEKFEFKLALFDTSHAYNICYSSESVSQFLLAALDLLEKNPKWGAILKPKSGCDYSALPQGALINSKIAALAKEGRLFIMERLVSPVSVAQAADLSLCCGFGSVGVLSGAFGNRAVQWDPAGWTEHPLAKVKDQKVMFFSLDDLRSAALAASRGDRTIGDFSRWRLLSNHFDDRQAPRRVGEWINDYMARIREGSPASDALRLTTDAYVERNKIGGDFFKKGEWWARP